MPSPIVLATALRFSSPSRSRLTFLVHLQHLQNLTLLVTNHSPPLAPIHRNRPLKQATILLNHPHSVALTRRALNQLARPPTAHILKDTLQLIGRRGRFRDFQLEGVRARHSGVLVRVVGRLVFGCGLRDLG